MKRTRLELTLAAVCLVSACASAMGQGATLTLQAEDFTLNPTFSEVRVFEFSIDLAQPITPGMVLDGPPLLGVDYRVFGTLADTPSGFPAFNLVRSIAGAEFYAQGSSLKFTTSPTADMSDGLQLSELSPLDPAALVFEFNGREVGTGRYHPSLIQLYADGTGLIQNSNNTGGINPANSQAVDVTFGEEYATQLTFDPSALTLVAAGDIPEPTTAAALLSLCLLSKPRRRTT